MDEGYIKFKCNWIRADAVDREQILEINACRERLYKLGLIGAYPDGIGFGNISIRMNASSFLITGSATGNLEKIDNNQYSIVVEFDIDQNSLTCKGPIKASSESLTHAMIYECSPGTNAVIHVHNMDLWKKLLNKAPTTKPEAAYGTPEIAYEIKRLFSESDVVSKMIIVMAGHSEGIIIFGSDIMEAEKMLLDRYI